MTPKMPTYGNRHVTADRWSNPQYGAAFYLFTRVPRAFGFVTDAGIEKAALLQASGTWSHGEQILVRVALDLFDPGCVRARGYRDASVGEIVGVLDADSLQVVLTAMQIARGTVRASDLVGRGEVPTT